MNLKRNMLTLLGGLVLLTLCADADAALRGRIDGGFSKFDPNASNLNNSVVPDRTFLRRIKGFAFDDLGGGTIAQVSVDLYINGVRVATQNANIARPDVQVPLGLTDALGNPFSNIGFDFDVPPLPAGSTSFTVDVKQSGTMTSLPGLAGVPFVLADDQPGGGPREPDYTTPRITEKFRYYRHKSLPFTVPLNGIKAEYFDHYTGFITLVLPRVVQVDPNIDFTFAAGTQGFYQNTAQDPPGYVPSPGAQRDHPHELVDCFQYGILWSGDIQPQFTETYEFCVCWDDVCQVIIDGTVVVSKTGYVANTPGFPQWGVNSGSIPLVAGRRHDIQVIFGEGAGGSHMQLWWRSPSQPAQVVPNSRLFANHAPKVDKAQLPLPNNNILVSTNEDTSVNINISAFDSDSFLGDVFTTQVLSLPANGVLNGTFPNFVYTPNPNFYGSDQFTFRMNDAIEDSPVYTVVITVLSQNDNITVTDDLFNVLEDTATNLTVLANDNAVDAPITVVILTPPTNGIATVNADGTISYTGNPNFFGSDTFTYRATDGDAQTGTATVIINVIPVNDPPVAGNDSVTANQDLPRTISTTTLLANDTDPVEGETVSITSVSINSVAGGTVSLAGGTIIYTPPAGFFGSDAFTYTLTDASGGTATGVVFINVGQAPSFSSAVIATPNPTVTNQQVFFTATVTFPQGPGPISWDFGDGTTGTGTSVTHAYANAGVYNVVVTAFDADGGRATSTVQVLVSFNVIGETGNGAANPPGAGVLVGGPGVGAKSGGMGKITIDYLNKDRTIFQGSLGKIKFPTNITQESLQGKAGILTVGTAPLAETFVFTLNGKGKGVATALSTIEVNIGKGSVKFRTGNRPQLTAIAEAAGAPYNPDIRSLRTIRMPVSLIFDNVTNFALAMTYQMVVKQVKTTAKGSTK